MTEAQQKRLRELAAQSSWSDRDLAEWGWLVDLKVRGLGHLEGPLALRPWSHSVSLLVHVARTITLLGAFFCTVAVTGRYTAGWAVLCSLLYLQLGES